MPSISTAKETSISDFSYTDDTASKSPSSAAGQKQCTTEPGVGPTVFSTAADSNLSSLTTDTLVATYEESSAFIQTKTTDQ